MSWFRKWKKKCSLGNGLCCMNDQHQGQFSVCGSCFSVKSSEKSALKKLVLTNCNFYHKILLVLWWQLGTNSLPPDFLKSKNDTMGSLEGVSEGSPWPEADGSWRPGQIYLRLICKTSKCIRTNNFPATKGLSYCRQIGAASSYENSLHTLLEKVPSDVWANHLH